MIKDKIFNFIIILYVGVIFIYLNQIPPAVVMQADIFDENNNIIPTYDEMCHSIEFRRM